MRGRVWREESVVDEGEDVGGGEYEYGGEREARCGVKGRRGEWGEGETRRMGEREVRRV